MKGIILAGGSGSRLYPITNYTSKHLIPVYNKPMIYYPLSTLMLAGVKDILIICKSIDLNNFKKLFGNGSYLGIKIRFEIQKKPSGIAEALKIGKSFIKKSDVYLILGDNIFYGAGLQNYFETIQNNRDKSYIFGSYVKNPQEFGIVNKLKNRLKIVEKPKKPKSNIAITGLYFYPNNCLKYVSNLKRSKRGELEITDFNEILSKKNQLRLFEFGRGFAWFDCGGHKEYGEFLEEYLHMCSGYLAMHYTYYRGEPNPNYEVIDRYCSVYNFERVHMIEPHKYRQGSFCLLRRV